MASRLLRTMIAECFSHMPHVVLAKEIIWEVTVNGKGLPEEVNSRGQFSCSAFQFALNSSFIQTPKLPAMCEHPALSIVCPCAALTDRVMLPITEYPPRRIHLSLLKVAHRAGIRVASDLWQVPLPYRKGIFLWHGLPRGPPGTDLGNSHHRVFQGRTEP